MSAIGRDETMVWDQRILGDSESVQETLQAASEESFEKPAALDAPLETALKLAADLTGESPERLSDPAQRRFLTAARAIGAYAGVSCFGRSVTDMANQLGLSISGASRAIARGKILAKQLDFRARLEDLLREI